MSIMLGHPKTWESWVCALIFFSFVFFFCFFFYCAQMLTLLTKLTAFTAFDICRKLNSAFCSYQYFLFTIFILLVMCFKKNFPVYWGITITQFIKIKLLMMKLITNIVWKICSEFSRNFVVLDSWKFRLF